MLHKTLEEIREIPHYAGICLEKNRNIKLPTEVFYLGMGASIIPARALYYSRAKIKPELASEYISYLSNGGKENSGVLISQSGKSLETVQCKDNFRKYTAITNNPDSPLAAGSNLDKLFLLHAGDETSISSKTYINTLITLYQGLGFQTELQVEKLKKNINEYEEWGEEQANRIFLHIQKSLWKGFYILGSGPNLATAKEAALTMSEVTKLSVQGMSLGEYDHGPKETAANSIVILLDIKGKNRRRAQQIREKIKLAKNCLLISYKSEDEENLSPINTIVPFNFLTYYLAVKLGVKKIYEIGDKVVEG